MDTSEEQAKKDIQAMVRYLKIYHPENANEVFAAAMLDDMQRTIRDMGRNNLTELKELYQAILQEQKARKK